MKQTKWQRLATIGLCSSLVINAFSGVTAVAETITIESSPTVASSAKEATSASSATPESTESSQETTETSREEVTQETEKPEVVKEETERAKKESESSSILQRAVGQTFISGRNIPIFFVDEYGSLFDPESISLTANVSTLSDNISGGLLKKAVPVRNENGGKVLAVPSSATYSYETTNSKPRTIYGVTDVMITIPKRFENISIDPSSIYTGGTTKYPLPTGFINKGGVVTNQSESNVKNGLELTNQNTANPQVYRAKTVNGFNWGNGANASYVLGYLYGDIYGSTSNHVRRGTNGPIYYYLTNRRVTESFKNTEGTDIPAPTGFTQGKQTVIDSDSFTFKQAGTLPETYKASNGKTYKFKGWYKGKTKPNTLTTTKAPSYAVTYDDNDDLNVVYEEIEAFDFPALTYQFGFVDESGKRVDASTIDLTYDNWHGELLSSVDGWKTTSIEKGQVALTKNNLKEIVYPSHSLEIMNGRISQYSAANLTFKIPKYYENISVYNKNGTFDTAYPFPTIKVNTSTTPLSSRPQLFQLKKSNNQSFIFNQTTAAAPADVQVPYNLREIVYDPADSVDKGLYHMLDKPIYYYLTNRKVTENFVDINGTKITPPTGFTQGKQTVINSDPYTFKQSGTLPDTYKAGTKTYKFKGWYKGKTKPNTLTTTKAPSYAVTYDDNDDLNVVYEEATEFPEETYQFGFVNEAGQLVNPDDINLTYDYKSIVYRGTGAAGSTVSFGTIANNQSGVKVGNLRQVTLPAKNIAQPTVVGWNGEAFANFSIKLPKYYKSLNLYDKTGKIDPKYPLPVKTTVSSVSNDTVQPEANVIAELTLTQRADGSFTPREIYSGIDSSVRYPPFLRRTVSYSSSGSITALYQTISGPVYYHLTNRKVTENFVNTSGAKITPPTGFTQGNQIPMTSNTFKYTSAKALPASYSAGGKTYVFQGWYKGKTKPNTLTTSTTPAYNTTFDDNDDMTAVYKEANISANLTMRGAVDVIDNGATMEYWEVLLKNTGEAPLTSVKIKPTTDWAAGISTPTELFILGTGQNTKVRPITKEQWEAGFEIPLDSSLPVGGQLTINLLGTKVTGQPNQVLKAAVEVTGNFNKLTASDTVRIKDLDQETKEPTGEGFISVPTFNFGQVGVAGSTQQHSLKKAADYYGNGTRNPYLRIKKTQPNWSLTAQLSQPKSATDSLPTATRLLLGAAPVSSFSNYNQPTELKNAVGTTSTISLNANNTATRIIANQQFTGSNIYQLDFTFNNVKLEVPANQGVKGQQYQAAITWNLVTGP
ncbi:hypothetical protein IGJ46_002468 [Enterococcus sp. AZ120]|uniref:WxL domain-containing protein n=1 Tax=Enterococcus TaxID=1350 RepID=UPI001C470826|nr:WxL domain-containing protein [Enterococcus faecalis]ELY8292427.1 WxL domain-containing protein [Enterococcus faecalis]QXN80210.1 WxL domain-containing protein [Enterococcus faecalis]